MKTFENVLENQQLEAIRAALDEADFEDGMLSAGQAIRSIKQNRQLKRHSDEPMPLDQLIVSALANHAAIRQFTLPVRFLAPLYCQYEPGMRYGLHVDAPFMGGSKPLRTDFSVTLAISAPDEYEGGELEIQSDGRAYLLKPPAGAAVVYPTFHLHQVREVTKGQRLVAVTWCQSRIQDPTMREIVVDLNRAALQLVESSPNSEAAKLVLKSANNLTRISTD